MASFGIGMDLIDIKHQKHLEELKKKGVIAEGYVSKLSNNNMEKKEKKSLWENSYLVLFSDGSLGISDGVGYVDTMEVEEVRELYMALEKYFKLSKLKDNK
jgi:hypothetical protein